MWFKILSESSFSNHSVLVLSALTHGSENTVVTGLFRFLFMSHSVDKPPHSTLLGSQVLLLVFYIELRIISR